MYGIGGGSVAAGGVGGTGVAVLASTGVSTIWPVLLGVQLIVVGAVMVHRRRSHQRAFDGRGPVPPMRQPPMQKPPMRQPPMGHQGGRR